MLESFNDYISLAILVSIVLGFVYILITFIFKAVERSRIKREMEKRLKDIKGEKI